MIEFYIVIQKFQDMNDKIDRHEKYWKNKGRAVVDN